MLKYICVLVFFNHHLYAQKVAVARLRGPGGASCRWLWFNETSEGIRLTGVVLGMYNGLRVQEPAKHGIHISTKGDLSVDCDSLGEHYNPYNAPRHGGPNDEIRHLGDLGNIDSDYAGVALVDILLDKRMTLDRENPIVGRAIVIHEFPDDLGKTGKGRSWIDGNSGFNYTCGVIGRYNF